MRAKAMTGLLLAAVLLLSGCAGSTGASVPAPGSSGATQSTLAFSGVTLDGAAFDGAQLAGKPAVLWFWAPWCSTCRAQSGRVQEVSAEYAGRVNVIGVGGLSGADEIGEFARSVVGPTYLVDVEGTIWKHFGVTAQSTYVLLDTDGAVVSQGYLNDDALSAGVEGLVG